MDADALYGLPLDEFTRARDTLARELRARGEREEAAQVAALRKPTLPAWAVNQVARLHPREVDLLLDASHRLIDAQTGRSPQEDVAPAVTRQRQAVSELTRLAAAVLGDRATPAAMTRVAETLRSASLGEEGRALLARGTLDRELSTTGWEIVEAAGPRTGTREQDTPSPKPGKEPSARAKAAAERKARIADAKAMLEAAKEQLAVSRASVRDADDEVRRVEDELAVARGEADEAHAEADAAAARVAAAEAALARAREPEA